MKTVMVEGGTHRSDMNRNERLRHLRVNVVYAEESYSIILTMEDERELNVNILCFILQAADRGIR